MAPGSSKIVVSTTPLSVGVPYPKNPASTCINYIARNYGVPGLHFIFFTLAGKVQHEELFRRGSKRMGVD